MEPQTDGEIDWNWLTGASAPPPDISTTPLDPDTHRVPDRLSDRVPDNVLDTMLRRATAAATALAAPGRVDPRGVIGVLGEVSTTLIAAAHELEADDPAVVLGLTRLGQDCQRAAAPFIHDPTHAGRPRHPARAVAGDALAAVIAALRQLAAPTGTAATGTTATAPTGTATP